MLSHRLCTQRLLLLLMVIALSACSVQQVRLPSLEITESSQPPTRETTIALLGGTGFVGGYLLREALAQGYPLRVLSRSSQTLAYLDSRITVVEGDARDPAVLGELLDGADVVISAIGPSRAGGDSRSGLNSAVTSALIPAMESAGIDRYLTVSGAAVVMPGDARNLTGWWMRQLVRLRYPGILKDRQDEHALLLQSELNWTLLRCPLIEGEDLKSSPQVSLRTPGGFYLRAGELAHFMLAQIDDPQYQRLGPFVSSH